MVPPIATSTPPIVYPESDGKPLAENDVQFRWIYFLYGNLAGLFHDRDDVFVSGDQLWYPVEGHPEIVLAPDVYVVFGRPKRKPCPSYKQWEENGIPMTVVFEIRSPSNTKQEMNDKRLFYETYGVEEYYDFDPDRNRLQIWRRRGTVLRRMRPANNFISPRLGIRFDLSGDEMVVYGPDGKPFIPVEEQRAAVDAAQRQADVARQRERRLAELSRKVRRGEASARELAELERLENEAGVD
jgi:Uma2 family endonuclease